MIMRYLHTILSLAIVSLLVACNDVGTSPSPGGVSAFKEEFLTLSVDADKAYSDRPVTFIVGCTPLVSGKGVVLFDGYGDYPESTIHVDTPVVAMLIRDSITAIPIPATFVANQPFEMPIRCRFQPGISGFFYVTLSIDSVFVADSNKYFDISSEIVQKLSPGGDGYRYQLSNKGGILSLYTP
jgi:hypothetical protein